MGILKKLLILLVILITMLLLTYLYNERIKIMKTLQDYESMQTMDDTSNDANKNSELMGLESLPIPSISNARFNNDLPLREYVVKGAYNAAFTGNYVNTEMIRHVLLRGCRFLDFEIYSVDKKPFVGFSNTTTFSKIESKNKFALADALQTINDHAFQSPTPNMHDPLFLHIRVKTDEDGLTKSIAQSIEENLRSRLYQGAINGTTKISKLIGKVVIVFDTSLAKFDDSSKKVVNIESNSDNLRLYRNMYITNKKIDPVYVKDDGISTDVEKYQIVLPDTGGDFYGRKRNPNSHVLVKDYGIQIICCAFYNQDSELNKFEKLFGEHRSAFVPLASAVHYIEKMEE